MPRIRRWSPLLALTLLVVGCRAAPSAGPAAVGPCPPPLAWSEGQPRPRGVRVENRTDEPVLVFMDLCRHHVRIGTVGAGATRLYRLPDRLVAVRGGLTFHLFRSDGMTHSVATLAVDTTAIVTLRVEPTGTAEAAPPPRGRPAADRREQRGGFSRP